MTRTLPAVKWTGVDRVAQRDAVADRGHIHVPHQHGLTRGARSGARIDAAGLRSGGLRPFSIRVQNGGAHAGSAMHRRAGLPVYQGRIASQAWSSVARRSRPAAEHGDRLAPSPPRFVRKFCGMCSPVTACSR